HFEASNDSGNTLHIDGSDAFGGQNLGFRPMQMALAAVAGCSVMDLVDIIKKYRMELQDIRITADAERVDAVPAVFKKIQLTYHLKGTIDIRKLERALDLAVNKYCSVGAMISKTAEITYSYEIEKGD